MNNIKISDVISYCKSESGCCFLRNGKYVILYNDDKSICKQRIIFTLAHELGHIILDHFNIYHLNILSDNHNNHKLKNQIEDEAEYFAACLLCPLPILTKIQIKSEIEIQKVFNLSKSASVIAWRQFKSYDRTLNIACHNKFLKLFADFISNYNNKLG
jgi:Zn-dependent peptidase ImmA (M78 family)